ncbi:MAG: UDP-N-acetylmuramate dehydrogenase [Syntrophomonadaceae bacterium]|jgi:UDP-N-acetylmuramate dehydrogenase
MYQDISDILPIDRIKFNEPMCLHTTFRIGGPADILAIPSTPEEVINLLRYCRQKSLPLFVFGLGSNLLVRDKGIRGVVMKLGEGLKTIQIKGQQVYAEAGVRMSEMCRVVAREGLSGLEFAEGIPGSLGGAIVMNAGAYGGEMKDVLCSVSAVDHNGSLCEFEAVQLQLGYRSSIFQKGEYIVLSAVLELTSADPEIIKGVMKDYAQRRRDKQPLDLPSAGSTFKRPAGFFVGPLLEQLGLKGFQIGGAQVSTKHAGFIVNTGNARAEDVLQLIAHVQQQALQELGVELHPEVKLVGEE